jgi:hypothetical protein
VRQLDGARTNTGRVHDLSWLKVWASARPSSAWAWFKCEAAKAPGDVGAIVTNFATAMAGQQWTQQHSDESSIGLMLEIAEMVRKNLVDAMAERDLDESRLFMQPKMMLYEIARGFVAIRGMSGRKALQQMLTRESDAERRLDMLGFLQEHAELDASAGQHWDIERLRGLHSAFDSEPQNEAQLYEQVLARLEEIRTLLEEGPFSERTLFKANTPEKHLQLWLAAKLWDTPNRRFSVHREEEVDNDKKTDIQLSCPAGNVCVEIKPVDADRGYSANSLSDTLQMQIVGQYLNGYNSSRGILVLVQLDTKGWHIPGGAKNQPFEALVQYLQHQAHAIKENSAGVNELIVFPIRCVI